MKRNVLFITADQWRAECLSCLGHRVRTPHLDALAREGVLFKRHYANAVPCGPSRASLHTGMYLQNHRSGTNGTPLDARHTNWALELRRRGHDPVLFGYTDTSNDPRAFEPGHPVLQSYEGPLPGIRPIVMMGEQPHAWAEWLAQKGYDIPAPVRRLYTTEKQASGSGGEAPAPLAIPAEHHDTWFMVDQAIEHIERNPKDFCVHLSLLRPHPPWVAPEPYNALYAPGELGDFARAGSIREESAQHPYLAWMLRRPSYAAPEDPKRMAHLKASYFGLMTEVDANLGRLFARLKAIGAWDSTLIVFTSDHGEQLGDHWLLGKLGYFEQSYRIPMILRDPRPEADATRGAVLDGFTENVDLMPTLLDWLGIDTPVQCDGESLLGPARSGRFPPHWRREAHWEFDFRDVPGGAEMERHFGLTQHQCTLNVIRGERYKYVHFTRLPPLFFDLETDPQELVNQAGNPDYQPRVLAYAQKLLSWRMNHDEQTLTHMALTDEGVVSRPAARY